jgi:hypothetical protein
MPVKPEGSKPQNTAEQEKVVSHLTQSEKTIDTEERPSSKEPATVSVDPKSETGKEQQTNPTTKTPRKGEEAQKRQEETGKDEEHDTDEYRQWRKGLLSQYMYLISAPFLAIATYYLCIWLAFKVVPLFVLVSFCVGLISDQIVDAIKNLVRELLRNNKSKPEQ